MREDFSKLLCEGHRHTSRYGKTAKRLAKKATREYNNCVKGDYEDWFLPKTQAMGMGRGTKSFGENLSPLIRFLRSAVGRKWDVVFSEIAKVCPNNGAVNAHIYQHLWGYVNKDAYERDGVVYAQGRYYSGERALEDRGNDMTFYVNGEGFLTRAPRRAKKEKEINYDVKLVDGQCFLRKKGIWFEGILKEIPKPTFVMKTMVHKDGKVTNYQEKVPYYFRDVFLDKSNSFVSWNSYPMTSLETTCRKTYGRKVYCAELKQINSKRIKKMKLNERNED
jgi:hypothetical protein